MEDIITIFIPIGSIQENPGKFKNNQSEYWDGKLNVYYTVKAREPYYGETFQWNGICLLAPYQMGPTLKNIKIKNNIQWRSTPVSHLQKVNWIFQK